MTEISSLVISHSKATVEEMEDAWEGELEELLTKLYAHDLVHECAVLKTCNRVEIYVVSPKGSSVLFHFAKEMGVSSKIVDFYDHDESLRHLLRLACGLESMIIGEDQILGQLKDMFVATKDAGTIGKVLETAFSKAIQVGKRARTETKINRGAVSIASAAVDLAEEILNGLEGRNILVIGTGEMGTLVTRALAHKDMNVVYLANRTYEKATDLAGEMGGEAVHFEQLHDYVRQSDVIISATSAPHYVLKKGIVEEAMEERSEDLLLIDIASPRDIDPDVENVTGAILRNIDSLRVINERNLQMRLEEAKKVEVIIDEEYGLLLSKYKQQKADALISDLYSQVYDLRKKELDKAINRLGAYHTLGEIELSVLDDLTRAIANKLLAGPTKSLRHAAEFDDEEFLDSVSQLFDIRPYQGNDEKDKCQ
ncbi:glutamyl-tRNA reductase [Methanohalophilus levihalophilus]|uniref:glutamyl-tRNA reductase n=1 Tax=Methanohalophilus levihalophilus TaxID=1431282 RepID=UPI001AE44E53|nr:glutamyl-tRNA reductase [Methanohalophilus levihalophilus]MBP2031053.1 glutamyl-tRNA reductase [Methanohalophilus levihalophilus]